MRTYEISWHILFVGTFEIRGETDEEAMEIAEWELHHNPEFLEMRSYETEADIDELLA